VRYYLRINADNQLGVEPLAPSTLIGLPEGGVPAMLADRNWVQLLWAVWPVNARRSTTDRRGRKPRAVGVADTWGQARMARRCEPGATVRRCSTAGENDRTINVCQCGRTPFYKRRAAAERGVCPPIHLGSAAILV